MQHELRAAQGSLPDERQLRFRIGVHLGDVIEKTDGTVYGDGVNIAARLQALAEAGGITVSDAVQGAVRGKVAATFVDQGEQPVKNLPHPVRTFGVHPDGGTDTPTADAYRAQPPPLPDRPSLAVLPFTNMSGDPEQDYFADGMVEDIITALARTRLFFVIARNSTFVYKGKAVDIKRVGRELGVRYVLEGSVRKSGSRVRITGQLIEVATRPPCVGRPLRGPARRRVRAARPHHRGHRVGDGAQRAARRDRAHPHQAAVEPAGLRADRSRPAGADAPFDPGGHRRSVGVDPSRAGAGPALLDGQGVGRIRVHDSHRRRLRRAPTT